MYELAISLLNQYVEVYTYLTKDKLYGEIISATPYEIILLRRHINKASNKKDPHITSQLINPGHAYETNIPT